MVSTPGLVAVCAVVNSRTHPPALLPWRRRTSYYRALESPPRPGPRSQFISRMPAPQQILIASAIGVFDSSNIHRNSRPNCCCINEFAGRGWGLGSGTMAAAPAHAPTYSLKSTLAFSSFDSSSRVNSKGFSSCASVRIHPRAGRARAGLEGESAASEYKESVARPVVRRRKTVPTPTSPSLSDSDDPALSLETVLVEDERVSLEGVGRVDREAASSSFSWGRAGTLAAGDLVALVTFAVIGRASHGLTTLNWDALRTSDPFIAGWLLGSYFLGGYGPDGQGVNGVSRAVTAALKSWAVGVPLGLVIRGIVTSHMPAQAFILVSMGSLLVLMVGWRVAYVYVFANGGNAVETKPANRSGGVFEFLELLTSLVRRW